MDMLSTKLDFIVQLLWEAGISNWVISPGSRNAPLVASFIKHGKFQLISSPDERSGAFMALGMSQINQYPAGFICTSGSALVNTFPAVVEAYYQRIPLLILSADRPEELIDQWDGQTLRQPGIFGNYVRSNLHCSPRNESTEQIAKGIYDCLKEAFVNIPSATHLNIALSEPIYEGIDAPFAFSDAIPPFVFKPSQPNKVDLIAVKQFIESSFTKDEFVPDSTLPIDQKLTVEESSESIKYPRIAVLIGQNPPSPLLKSVLIELQHYVPIFADVCSSQTQVGLISWDWGMLKREIPNYLEPELLISVGTATISKPLKQFLQKSKPKHIHIGLYDEVGDPFETQPQHWKVNESDFLQAVLEIISTFDTSADETENSNWVEDSLIPTFQKSNNSNSIKKYLTDWEVYIQSQSLVSHDLPHPFASELQFMQKLFQSVQENCIIHLGNSMSVRYGSWSGQTKAQVYSNRGVSGIDGCLSTAVGAAIASPEKHHVVVLGDVSTIYDSNALWTDLPSNLTIVVFNNGGGRIFDWIEGPNKLQELRTFIHTPRHFEMEYLCKLYSVKHFKYSINQLDEILNGILENSDKLQEKSDHSHPNLDEQSSPKTVRFFELISE